MQPREIQWSTPVSQFIVAIAWTVILNRPWVSKGQWRVEIDNSSNALMDWVSDEPTSFELIMALDEFSSGLPEVVNAEDLMSRYDTFQHSLGLEPVEREQLGALLALFVLREPQSDDELTESLSVFWKVLSEFDIYSLPDVVKGIMYLADLLTEGEATSTILPQVRGLYREDEAEIAEFKNNVLLPALNSPSWFLRVLRSSSPRHLCVHE